MNEAEARHRAAEAERLLNEPLLREAFEGTTRSALAELLACRGAEPEDDRKRRMLVDRLYVIEELRSHLEMAIAQGSYAAPPERSWA